MHSHSRKEQAKQKDNMEKVFFLKMHIKRNRTERNPKNLKNFFSANIVLPMIFVVCQREVLSTRTEEKRVCWSRRKILSLQYCPLKTCHELSMREESDKMKGHIWDIPCVWDILCRWSTVRSGLWELDNREQILDTKQGKKSQRKGIISLESKTQHSLSYTFVEVCQSKGTSSRGSFCFIQVPVKGDTIWLERSLSSESLFLEKKLFLISDRLAFST